MIRSSVFPLAGGFCWGPVSVGVNRYTLQDTCHKVHVSCKIHVTSLPDKVHYARYTLQGMCCNVPVTRHVLQGAGYKVHITRYPLQCVRYKMLVTRYTLQGICYKVPVTRYTSHGDITRYTRYKLQ